MRLVFRYLAVVLQSAFIIFLFGSLAFAQNAEKSVSTADIRVEFLGAENGYAVGEGVIL